jgi:hypothetical protein
MAEAKLNKILFIIPAHESNECLVDTVNNILKYNPDVECYFVIHITRSFADFNDTLFVNNRNVVVAKYLDDRSGNKYESQLESLIKSYTYAKTKFSDFDYVKIFHTSELFVRYGFYDYIKNYDLSYKEPEHEEPLPQRYHPIMEMGAMRHILQHYQDPNSYRYQMVEAGFYSKFVFDDIEDCVYNSLSVPVDKLNSFFNYTPIEEIVIPTLSIATKNFYKLKQGKNVLKFPINPDEAFTLEDNHFTVKSVPRNIDHPLRVSIRNG